MPGRPAEKVRDADRSREAILAAAERLFAERGYDAASLSDIGSAAGLSRGTPSYFFGSKERLYLDVLRRAFERRQSATEAAFEPVLAWCRGDEGPDALRPALAAAADGYLAFLLAHPGFVRLVMREELAGGTRLQAVTGASRAMQDAFAEVRRVGGARGLRDFDVDEAVLLFVALTFAPLSYRSTLLRAVDRDLRRPADRRRHVALAADELMALIAGDLQAPGLP